MVNPGQRVDQQSATALFQQLPHEHGTPFQPNSGTVPLTAFSRASKQELFRSFFGWLACYQGHFLSTVFCDSVTL